MHESVKIIIIASLTHRVFYTCYSMRFFPAKKHIIYEPRTWRTKKLSNPFLNVKKNREMHLEQTGHPEYICGFSVGLNTYAAPTVFILARSSVQSLSCVRLFETPRIAACQASLFITKSRSSFNSSSRLVIAFLPRSKCLLISWLQSQPAVILQSKKIKSVTIIIVSTSICHSTATLSSVQFSHSVVSDSLRPHGKQHARPPCSSPTPGVYPDLCPSSW